MLTLGGVLLNFGPVWCQWTYQVLVAAILYGMRQGTDISFSMYDVLNTYTIPVCLGIMLVYTTNQTVQLCGKYVAQVLSSSGFCEKTSTSGG